jgi:hypothetical protein
MAMRSRHRRASWAGVFGAALGLLQVGCTAYPATPTEPAFDTDVLPIFEAHCTRCHGAGPDGGARNVAYIPGMGNLQPAQLCLTQFGNNPYADLFTGCKAGAGGYATRDLIWKYIQSGYVQRMPPPPAPLLNPWEMQVINAWIGEADPNANPPVLPICSRSSSPDPALLCNSM